MLFVFDIRFFLVLLLCLLAGCGAQTNRQEVISGSTMGTTYNVKYAVSDSSTEPARLAGEIQRELDRLENLMSTYIQDSELSRLNASGVGQQVSITQDTYAVIDYAYRMSELSGGAFDMTVGPLVSLWGFGPAIKKEDMPSKDEIGALLSLVGYQHISLDTKSLSVTKLSDVTIDLSAIAKGYAVDKVSELMVKAGVEHFLVEVGGETRVSGNNANGSPWRLGIERPHSMERSAFAIVGVSDLALATSGDYRNFFMVGDKAFSHTISPKTGMPVEHNLASVSVLAESCMEADALATALLVMGEEKGYNFAVENNLSAYFIYRDGDRFRVRMTDGFSPFVIVDGRD